MIAIVARPPVRRIAYNGGPSINNNIPTERPNMNSNPMPDTIARSSSTRMRQSCGPLLQIGLVVSAILAGLTIMAATPAMAQPAATQQLPSSTRLAMPGEKQAWFAPLVGDWNVEMLVYPAPGARPITSTQLTAKRELILGGRYLREELIGQFGGNASHRIMILGYNALDERFELVSVDTFEPGMMSYHGPATTADRITLTGESIEAGFGPNPTGRKRTLRFEFEIKPTSSVERIFAKYPGEAEFLFVEQRFTKKR
jgi:hypothetical protein